MIQGNEGALTSNTIAKSGVVSVPDELCPVAVDDAGPGLDKRVLDAIEEGGVLIEIGDGNSFQLKTFAGKISVDELLDLAIRGVGSVDGGEVCEDLAGRFVCWLVDEGLLVRVQVSDVYGLEELSGISW